MPNVGDDPRAASAHSGDANRIVLESVSLLLVLDGDPVLGYCRQRVERNVDALHLRHVEAVDLDGLAADCVLCARFNPFALPDLSKLFRFSFLRFCTFRVVLERDLCRPVVLTLVDDYARSSLANNLGIVADPESGQWGVSTGGEGCTGGGGKISQLIAQP